MIKVYLASPYSNGNKEQLVNLQFDAAYHLLKMGYNPYVPLYNHYIQERHPDLDGTFNWITVDLQWLEACDIMVRLYPKDKDGNDIPSPGADREEEYAKKLNLPIFKFDNIESMVMFFKDHEFEDIV